MISFVPKRLLVALQPQLPQPSRDVHKRPSSGGDRVANSYQNDGSEAMNPSPLLRPPIPSHNVRCDSASGAKGVGKSWVSPLRFSAERPGNPKPDAVAPEVVEGRPGRD